jgi:hypothetical protein
MPAVPAVLAAHAFRATLTLPSLGPQHASSVTSPWRPPTAGLPGKRTRTDGSLLGDLNGDSVTSITPESDAGPVKRPSNGCEICATPV